MADAAAQAQENKEALDDLIMSLQQYGVISSKVTSQSGLLEKAGGKLRAMWEKNPVVKLTKSTMKFVTGTKAMLKQAQKQKDWSKKEQKINRKKMTTFQSLGAALLTLGGTQKAYNRYLGKTNNLAKKLLVNFLSLFGIFLIVIVGLAMLSIAFQGANSPFITMTEGIPVLHEAMLGLLMVIQGEGEGGLAGAINVAAAALLVFLGIALVFSVPVAIVVGTLMLVVGTFRLVKKATGDTVTAVLVALAVAAVGIAAFTAFTGTAVLGMTAAIMLPVALIVLAFAGIWAAITGKAPYWIGIIGAIVLAIVVVIFFPIYAIPALIIAFVVIIFLLFRRFGKQALGLIIAAKDWLLGSWWGTLAFLTIAAATIIGFPFAIGAAILIIIWKYRDQIWGVLVSFKNLVMAFGAWLWDHTIGGLLNSLSSGYNSVVTKKDQFVAMIAGFGRSIMKSIGLDKFPTMSGILKAITGIIMSPIEGIRGLINSFVIDTINEVLGWNPPVIPGGKIKSILGLSYLPHLARGGIVTGPTTARLGEQGPEAVIPLSKTGFGGGLGGSMTVNINVSGVTDRSDKRRLAREISDILAQEMRRQGGATTRGHF